MPLSGWPWGGHICLLWEVSCLVKVTEPLTLAAPTSLLHIVQTLTLGYLTVMYATSFKMGNGEK